MSKIKVFMKKDGTEISSLVVPGFRMLRPGNPTGKRPIKSKYMHYVTPCEVHDGREPSVVLEVREYEEDNPAGIPAGRVKICFFCWALLEKIA